MIIYQTNIRSIILNRNILKILHFKRFKEQRFKRQTDYAITNFQNRNFLFGHRHQNVYVIIPSTGKLIWIIRRKYTFYCFTFQFFPVIVKSNPIINSSPVIDKIIVRVHLSSHLFVLQQIPTGWIKSLYIQSTTTHGCHSCFLIFHIKYQIIGTRIFHHFIVQIFLPPNRIRLVNNSICPDWSPKFPSIFHISIRRYRRCNRQNILMRFTYIRSLYTFNYNLI